MNESLFDLFGKARSNREHQYNSDNAVIHFKILCAPIISNKYRADSTQTNL
jgi:hypothetical protein